MTQSTPSIINVTKDKGIAWVELNRPDKKNALDLATFRLLTEIQSSIATDNTIRAVILHGAGSSFCAGLDLSVMGEMDSVGDLSIRSHGQCNLFQQAAIGWHQLPIPVIAALHGHCLGGGLQIALGADIRVAHAETKFCVMEIEWGLIPDMGLSVLAPGLIAKDQLNELVLSGKICSGDEAAQLGLVTRLAEDPLAEAAAIATRIASKSPDAVVAGKRLLSQPKSTMVAQLQAESEAMKKLIGSHNQFEAIGARLEQRTPNFRDREQ